MTDEKKPLPALALTAMRLLSADYERNCQVIAQQALDALDLDSRDGWQLDFQNGFAIKNGKPPEGE